MPNSKEQIVNWKHDLMFSLIAGNENLESMTH